MKKFFDYQTRFFRLSNFDGFTLELFGQHFRYSGLQRAGKFLQFRVLGKYFSIKVGQGWLQQEVK